MCYYEDNRFIICENEDGTYNIYDFKYGGRSVQTNQSKESIDIFIQKRAADPLANTKYDCHVYKKTE